ncbi:17701_t:CDS:2 [Gigaspora rosea]|nr:17701_t:CDS:2 [Gigaspora rosea]
MSQADVSHNEFDNSEEESSENEVGEVASQEASRDLFLPVISINRNGISKWRPLEKLSIPDSAFEQASNLRVGLQFEHWDHANLVLLAYRQKEGFAWRIQDKKLDKNGGFQSKKKTIELSQQRNRKSIKTNCTCYINICWPLSASRPSITKLNLTHYGHALCPDNAHFINVYRQLPQNIIDKIGFYVDAVPDISQHTLRQLLQGEFKDQLFLDKDLANVIQHFRKGDSTDPAKDPENDASNLLRVLRTFKEEDPTWFIADHYNTARTNKYRLALCLFIGVDEHRRSRVLAQALISDETTSSYTWVLNNIITATDNLPLSTIFSDCDTGLGPAIKVTFPATRYLHCIFHIIQNIKKQLARSLGSRYTEFLADFLAC